SVPSFFGGLQKLDRYVNGLVFAFGVYSTDNDLKDQSTMIQGKTVRSVYIERYHRTSNARSNTFFVGAAVGKRILSNLAVGFGLQYMNVDELVQEYQDAKQTVSLPDGQGGVVQAWRILGSNVRERL